jgi:hypothetical protein
MNGFAAALHATRVNTTSTISVPSGEPAQILILEVLNICIEFQHVKYAKNTLDNSGAHLKNTDSSQNKN